jgi:hypothetical protein
MSSARGFDRQVMAVGLLAAMVSFTALLDFLQRDLILIYGDAEGHINIARRIFDSRTPGLLQIGTVWLPLPHLLILPFVVNLRLWSSAVGGSIPSMIAYIFGAMGIFRLVRGLAGVAGLAARVAPWLAVLLFAGNPNLIYLQTTAMTEPLYLALFVWAVVYLSEFVGATAEGKRREGNRALIRSGVLFAAGMLTRYDAWFMAALVAAVLLVLAWRGRVERRPIAVFVALIAGVAIFWFGYNALVYGSPLEFLTGPLSAKAIEHRIVQPPHPGTNNLAGATLYFIKAVQLNLAAGWTAKLWLLAGLAGSAAACWRKQWVVLVLWLPCVFYSLSVAYAGVPIYVPTWWPFGKYNVRYGLQLLPAVAVGCSVALAWVEKKAANLAPAIAGVAVVLALGAQLAVWRSEPICLGEALLNMRARYGLETALARQLQFLPSDATILMSLRDYPGAVERAGIPLKRLIFDDNHRPWVRPRDPQGLWEQALEKPEAFADFAIGFPDIYGVDPVEQMAQARGLKPVMIIHSTQSARIYRLR